MAEGRGKVVVRRIRQGIAWPLLFRSFRETDAAVADAEKASRALDRDTAGWTAGEGASVRRSLKDTDKARHGFIRIYESLRKKLVARKKQEDRQEKQRAGGRAKPATADDALRELTAYNAAEADILREAGVLRQLQAMVKSLLADHRKTKPKHDAAAIRKEREAKHAKNMALLARAYGALSKTADPTQEKYRKALGEAIHRLNTIHAMQIAQIGHYGTLWAEHEAFERTGDFAKARHHRKNIAIEEKRIDRYTPEYNRITEAAHALVETLH